MAAVNGGAAPDYTNQLNTIHINNWNEVNELNFAEFADRLLHADRQNPLRGVHRGSRTDGRRRVVLGY